MKAKIQDRILFSITTIGQPKSRELLSRSTLITNYLQYYLIAGRRKGR